MHVFMVKLVTAPGPNRPDIIPLGSLEDIFLSDSDCEVKMKVTMKTQRKTKKDDSCTSKHVINYFIDGCLLIA